MRVPSPTQYAALSTRCPDRASSRRRLQLHPSIPPRLWPAPATGASIPRLASLRPRSPSPVRLERGPGGEVRALNCPFQFTAKCANCLDQDNASLFRLPIIPYPARREDGVRPLFAAQGPLLPRADALPPAGGELGGWTGGPAGRGGKLH